MNDLITTLFLKESWHVRLVDLKITSYYILHTYFLSLASGCKKVKVGGPSHPGFFQFCEEWEGNCDYLVSV